MQCPCRRRSRRCGPGRNLGRPRRLLGDGDDRQQDVQGDDHRTDDEQAEREHPQDRGRKKSATSATMIDTVIESRCQLLASVGPLAEAVSEGGKEPCATSIVKSLPLRQSFFQGFQNPSRGR